MKKAVMIALAAAVIAGGGVALKGGEWDGRSRFTVISIGDTVKVESIDPAVSGGMRFTLPGNLELETVGGRGKWRAEVLAKLAQKYGKKWAADSVANYLGIGYTAEKSELGMVEKWRWWKSEVEWREVDMTGEGLVREVAEVDGQRVLVLSENWEPAARKWFVSGKIANENLSVEIENASGVDGAGNNAARMIEAAGIKVDKVESGAVIAGKCVIEAPVSEVKKTGIIWLKRQLGCTWRRGEQFKVTLAKGYGEWWKGD